MATAATSIQQTAVVHAPMDTVWAQLSDVDHVAGLIHSLDEVTPLGDDAYHFELRRIHVLGTEIRPGAKLALRWFPPDHITLSPVADSAEHARATIDVRLTDAGPIAEVGHRTRVTVKADLELQLRLPRLLTGPATAVMRHELNNGVRQFLDNLVLAVHADA